MRSPSDIIDALDVDGARDTLGRCCGAKRWVDAMIALRPFGSRDALLEAAEKVWASLGRDDYLEAFSHHPRIGESIEELRRKFAPTAPLSEREQAGVAGASEATLRALRDGNVEYAERFGFIFIVCAAGKSAEEMLATLRSRFDNDADTELRIAGAEQLKITRLRLEKLTG